MARRYYWEQCYEMGNNRVHWALCDTESAKEGRVSCLYMILKATYRKADGVLVSDQPMLKRIIRLLNEDEERQEAQAIASQGAKE